MRYVKGSEFLRVRAIPPVSLLTVVVWNTIVYNLNKFNLLIQ